MASEKRVPIELAPVGADVRDGCELTAEVRFAKRNGRPVETRFDLDQAFFRRDPIDHKVDARLVAAAVDASLGDELGHDVRRLDHALGPGQVTPDENVETDLCVGLVRHQSHLSM